MTNLTLDSLRGQNILLRADLDIPIEKGVITNDFRLRPLLPTLKTLLANQNKILIIGHLGRPTSPNPEFSLKPVKDWLEKALNQPISFILSGFSPGEWWGSSSPLCLLENLRFDSREESPDLGFARELSTNANYYLYDAFAAYRPCTSLSLIPKVLPTIPGIQFQKEIATLRNVLFEPKHPTLLIASGAKEDKLILLKQIAPKFDQTIYGGKFAPSTSLTTDGLDLNESAISTLLEAITTASTIVLNGPLGYYEDGIHHLATKSVYQALKNSTATTILGGGDTIASITALGFNYTDFSFVSTGGGAMLEFLATGTHPLLEVLK